MTTHDGYDAQDSYERAGDAMGENFHNGNVHKPHTNIQSSPTAHALARPLAGNFWLTTRGLVFLQKKASLCS